jgi:hypothetical protein
LAGVVREFEEVVRELLQLRFWVNDRDVELLRQAFAWHFEMTMGRWEEVDGNALFAVLVELEQRAGVEGDERWRWGFGQWQAYLSAAMRGEEYVWPDVPEALAVWS